MSGGTPRCAGWRKDWANPKLRKLVLGQLESGEDKEGCPKLGQP